MPKCAAPVATSHSLVDDTAHTSQPCSASRRVSSCISEKTRGRMTSVKNSSRRLIQCVDGDATMHGDHFAAHSFFAHFSGFVKAVAFARCAGNFRADDAALDLPIEKVAAGVAAP